MKISDELREWCDLSFSKDDFSRDDFDKLRELADRVDAETVGLPRDADGRVVPLDTKVMYDAVGKKLNISSFIFECDAENSLWSYWKIFSPDVRGDDGTRYVNGLHLTPPDSLECIADELDEWCNRVNAAGGTCDVPRGLADRIRKLAEKEDENVH